MRSDRCPRSNQAMITLSCVILPFLILGQGANPTLPKTKQEIQTAWDATIEKIVKKHKVDKRTAGNAIEVVEYIADLLSFIKDVKRENVLSQVMMDLPNQNDNLACRKYGALLFGEINKILKSGIFDNYKYPDKSSLGELENDQRILEGHIKKILAEKDGEVELLAIKIFINAAAKKRAKEVAEKKRIDAVYEKLIEEERNDNANMALLKKNQDEENARAAMARQRLGEQQKIAERNKEIAEMPDKIKKLEDKIKTNNEKLKTNKEASEQASKDINASKNAIALDTRRLASVPLSLKKSVIDRINATKSKIEDCNKLLEIIKIEDQLLKVDIEKNELAIKMLMISKMDEKKGKLK